MSSFPLTSDTNARHHFFASVYIQRRIAFGVFVVIAALDLLVPHVNFSILFCLPLLLLANRGENARQIWYCVGLAAVTLCTIYVLKQLVVYGRDPSVLLSYRIYNRTFAIIMMMMLGVAAQAWLYWQYERTLLDYLDRDDEDKVNCAAAVIASIGLGLLITAIDLLSPSNFNLTVLSVVPVYFVSWTRDRKAIWFTAVALVALNWVGYVFGPPPVELGWDRYIIINHLLVSLALVLQAALLSWQVRCNELDAIKYGVGMLGCVQERGNEQSL